MPSFFVPGFFVEEIDASGMYLCYEGFDNLSEFISLIFYLGFLFFIDLYLLKLLFHICNLFISFVMVIYPDKCYFE